MKAQSTGAGITPDALTNAVKAQISTTSPAISAPSINAPTSDPQQIPDSSAAKK
jgi:hypothetical protein